MGWGKKRGPPGDLAQRHGSASVARVIDALGIRRARWPALLGVLALALPACKHRAAPAPERLVDVNAEVFDAAVDGAHVYFLSWRSPTARIARLPLAGGAIEQLGEDTESPRHIAIGADAIYWTTEVNLKRMPKQGGTPELFAAHVDGAIAVDDREVFSFERKASGQERLVARDFSTKARRVVAEEVHGAEFLVLDADSAYLARGTGGGPVERVPKSGGVPVTLAKSRFGGPLALLGDDVYYCNLALLSVSKRGGEPRKINDDCAERLVTLGGEIFGSRESVATGFGGHQTGAVFALPRGGRSRMLFDGVGAQGLVAAEGALYFSGRTKDQPSAAWMRQRPVP